MRTPTILPTSLIGHEDAKKNFADVFTKVLTAKVRSVLRPPIMGHANYIYAFDLAHARLSHGGVSSPKMIYMFSARIWGGAQPSLGPSPEGTAR